ncbi:hypothetical protein [Cohaesibacter intestini]|uniref:hypothetical protein n=1 Tax=Cohaesibacter intestini TaxID=2211145 RepID=UPI0018E5029D|nr:hypothetical protein [Cohaesibacter intestini]
MENNTIYSQNGYMPSSVKAKDIFEFIGYMREDVALHEYSLAGLMVSEFRPILEEAIDAYAEFEMLHPEAILKEPFEGLPDDHPLVQNWLCAHVLPAIARDDCYFVGEEDVKAGKTSFEEFFRNTMQSIAKTIHLSKTRH